MVNKEYVTKLAMYAIVHGESEAKKSFSLNDETWNRYKREIKKTFGDISDILSIKEQFSKDELQALASGVRVVSPHNATINFTGDRVKFGIISDTHIGSRYTNPDNIFAAIDEMKKEKVDFIVHPGDITEGMMGRPGDIYEMTHIGYKAQRDESIRIFSKVEVPLYMISGNHDCLSPDTECLTNHGWKVYTDIKKDDLIYSYDTEKNIGTWDHIKEVIVKNYKGDLFSIEGSYNFMGTPTHRVLHRRPCPSNIKNGGNGFSDWTYKEASKIRGEFQVGVAAFSNNEEYPISDDMLRLVAWLQTDGSITRINPSHTGNYCIYQSKDISEILELADRLALYYTLTERQRDIKSVCGKLLKKQPLSEKHIRLHCDSARKVKKYIYDKKTMPTWLFQISDRQFEVYLATVKKANGSYHKIGSTKAYAIYGRKSYLDELQVLCITHGKRASISYDNRGCPLLNITPDRATLAVQSKNGKYVPYDGLVWCLSVPKTNFMVRRGGKAYFTGNCSYDTKHGVGVKIVEDICNAIPNAVYLGEGEGDLHIKNITIRLFHGLDGANQYALSYRGQKIIEGITGGEKPHIIFAGHSHKALSFFYRNIHYIETGTLQYQSAWMRGKRLAAHTGFWIVEMCINDEGVAWFQPRWYPIYK